MEAEVRKAGKGDAPYIFILISTSIGMGDFLLPRKEEEIRELIGKGNFFAAAEGDKLIGCASLEEYNGVAELRSLAVEENWRGRGIGKRLIGRVAGLAKERRYETLYAFADESLVGFYREQGFEDRGRFIGKDGSALDINRGTSEKMKRYCLDCGRYKSGLCNEHLMHKRLK